MSATRENRNMSYVEDASAAIGAVIVVANTTYETLRLCLPDDVDTLAIEQAFSALSDAHDELQGALRL